MKNLLCALFLIPCVSFGQHKIETLPLSDAGNSLNVDYLHQLDSVFAKSRIIGLGESTHGTSEFTTIRAEIFKFLVENHNYSIFFLEADYNACSRVNRYIQGAEDDGKKAFLEVRLWPWLTQEMLDLVEWMREYNLKHGNVLEFVGCDMQLMVDDTLELQRYFSLNSKFEEFETKLPSLDFNWEDTALVRSKQKEWLQFSQDFLSTFPEEEPLPVQTVNQWFEEFNFTGNKWNFRDSCMANNLADYLERRPTKKGIYFAHNAHVGKIATQFEPDSFTFRRAGDFLKERFGNQYFAVAFEFNTGSFNAQNFIDGEHVMEYFTFKNSKRKSLAKYVLRGEDKVKFLPINSIPDSKRLRANSLGAIYGKDWNGNKVQRFGRVVKEHYDAYIVINKGTPTKLLTKNARKH